MDATRGMGRSLFAAVLLLVGSVLNIIYGIAAISNSHFFVNNTHYIFGSLNAWGWVALVIGVAELAAALSLFGGGAYGRYFGIVVGSLAAIDALLAIPAYPFLGLAIFALSLWIVHGLAVYRGPRELEYEPPARPAAASAPRSTRGAAPNPPRT